LSEPKRPDSKRIRAEAFLFLATFFWGTTFVIVKLAVADVPPMLYLSMRFGLAAIIFAAILGGKIFPIKRELLAASFWVSVWYFLGFLFQTVGLTYTTASKSAFITGAYVLFTPLLQAIFKRRLPPIQIWIAATLSFIGLYLLSVESDSLLETNFNIGDALTLCCALSYGIYIVLVDRLTSDKSFEGEPNLSFKLAFVQVLFCAAASLAASFAFETPSFSADATFYILLIYISIFPTIISTTLQVSFQKDTTPSRAAIIFMCEAVISTALAFVFLNESLGVVALVGAGVMLLGLFVSERS
jgi:drug/metabolite transporter (DMT)-like permease